MVLEGKGSYGIVLSSPRIPLENEKYEDIETLNEVSKILYSYDEITDIYFPAKEQDIKMSYFNLIKLIKDYPTIFDDNNFLLPMSGGYIDKRKFSIYFKDSKYNYGFNWLSKCDITFNLLNDLFKHENKLFQIVYKKGEKINFDLIKFMSKIHDVLLKIKECIENNFYFDDIKYLNLITHDNRIKIIDFDEPINLNLDEEEYIKMIENSKLISITYYPYDIISNTLLFEFIEKNDKIGKFYDENYFEIVLVNSLECPENILHRIKLINQFVTLWKNYLPDFTVELDIIDLNKFKENNNNEKIKINYEIFEKSIKIIYECYFLTNISYCKNTTDITEFIDFVNSIFYEKKKYINTTCKGLKSKIEKLLLETNIHSFGFIFLDWLNTNKNKITRINLQEFNILLAKIIKIVSNSCLNFVIENNSFYFVERNFDKINKIMVE